MRIIFSTFFLILFFFISSNAEAPKSRNFIATAYCLKGRTASGEMVHKGVLSADPTVLPLGTKVHIEAGTWSGEYTVKDTGGAIKGHRLDLWVPARHEAMKFGRRTVKLTILSYGSKVNKIIRPRLVKNLL